MKRYNYASLLIFTGLFSLCLGASLGLSATTEKINPSIQKNTPALSTDGSVTSEKTRITQAQRQAAAKRAKEKGFVAPSLEKTNAPVDAPQNEGGGKK